MARALAVALRLAALATLVLLDARDLHFKWRWLGARDAFRVSTSSVERLEPSAALRLVAPADAAEAEIVQRASGWSSFLQACDALEGFQSKYFFHARLRNCTVGGNAETSRAVVAHLIVSSGVRADSMAWVACQLLYMHRRPPLCHENIVLEFLRRYAMEYPRGIHRGMLFPPMSDAEAEALQLLDVISKSAPLSSVVCVEGFEFAGSKRETLATLFACASPTAFQVAFIGRHGSSFATLHRPMAWLTVHDLNLAGMHFVVRQNAISTFSVTGSNAELTSLTLVHESAVNLSSSGVLYHLLLVTDLLLLIAHSLSALELASLVLWRSERLKLSGGDVGKLSTGFFAISLYRSSPVVVLSIASQIVSWILVLPLSVILSWSDSPASWLHASMTIVRVWTLVLLSLRALWHWFVTVNEAAAYRILRFTYVSPFEVIAVAAASLLALRPQLMSIREKKYNLDKQRLVDTTTFANVAVVSNAYHDEQDFFPLASRASAVSLLYVPLAQVLALSILALACLLVCRFVYFKRKSTTDEFAAMSENRPSSPHAAAAAGGPYARLPAEELLATPIRAEQLVRGRLSLETASPSQKWLRAEQYLEHGVVLEAGRFLRTRQGFLGVARPKIRIDDDHDAVGGHGHLDDDQTKHESDAAADSPTKKRRMSAHIPSLR